MTISLVRSAVLAFACALGCEAGPVPHEQHQEQEIHRTPWPVMSQNSDDLPSHVPESPPSAIAYVQQANGIRIPTTDWDHGEQRYLVLNGSGLLDMHERTAGRIEHDGKMYDCRMDLVDSNHDGQVDLARLTVDYVTRRHRSWLRQGRHEKGRAIIQDIDHDGITDVMWQDIYDRRHRGFDGIYDRMTENEGGNVTMDFFIDRWIIFVRQPR